MQSDRTIPISQSKELTVKHSRIGFSSHMVDYWIGVSTILKSCVDVLTFFELSCGLLPAVACAFMRSVRVVECRRKELGSKALKF